MIQLLQAACQSTFRPLPGLSSAFAAQLRKLSSADCPHSLPRRSTMPRAIVSSAKRMGFQSAGNLCGLTCGWDRGARFDGGEASGELMVLDGLSEAASGVGAARFGGEAGSGANSVRGRRVFGGESVSGVVGWTM